MIELTTNPRTPRELADALWRVEAEMERWSEVLADQRPKLSGRLHGVLAPQVSPVETSQRSAELSRWIRETVVAMDQARTRLNLICTVLVDSQVVDQRW